MAKTLSSKQKDNLIIKQKKLIEEQKKLIHKQFLTKLTTLIVSAFGIVAALAWNDTIKTIFAHLYDKPEQILPMIIYSCVITLIAVIVAVWIGKVENK